jgi:hypothetical protein
MGGFDWYSGGSSGGSGGSSPSKVGVSRTMVYVITPLGKAKIPQYEGEGMVFNILTTLASNGPSSIGEIVKSVGGRWDEVTYKMENLAKLGYVVENKQTSGGGGGMGF